MTSALDEMISQQQQRVADVVGILAPSVHRPPRADALAALTAAQQRLQAVLDDLVARRDARTSAVEAHARALADHADELTMLHDDLDEQRRALGERVSMAVDALVDAYRAAEAFDAWLVDRSQRLQDAGLSACYKPGTTEEARFEDGGYPGGERRLVLGGRVWERVYAEQVLAYVQHAAVAACRYLQPQRFGTLDTLLDDVVRRPAPVPAPAPEPPKPSRLSMWAQ